jgi:hypothetical protein
MDLIYSIKSLIPLYVDIVLEPIYMLIRFIMMKLNLLILLLFNDFFVYFNNIYFSNEQIGNGDGQPCQAKSGK